MVWSRHGGQFKRSEIGAFFRDRSLTSLNEKKSQKVLHFLFSIATENESCNNFYPLTLAKKANHLFVLTKYFQIEAKGVLQPGFQTMLLPQLQNGNQKLQGSFWQG